MLLYALSFILGVAFIKAYDAKEKIIFHLRIFLKNSRQINNFFETLAFVFGYAWLHLKLYLLKKLDAGILTIEKDVCVVTYFHDTDKYKICFPKSRNMKGPFPECVCWPDREHPLEEDNHEAVIIHYVDDTIKEFAGPFRDFHGLHITPEMMKLPHLSIQKNGNKKNFKKNEHVSLQL